MRLSLSQCVCVRQREKKKENNRRPGCMWLEEISGFKVEQPEIRFSPLKSSLR